MHINILHCIIYYVKVGRLSPFHPGNVTNAAAPPRAFS